DYALESCGAVLELHLSDGCAVSRVDDSCIVSVLARSPYAELYDHGPCIARGSCGGGNAPVRRRFGLGPLWNLAFIRAATFPKSVAVFGGGCDASAHDVVANEFRHQTVDLFAKSPID